MKRSNYIGLVGLLLVLITVSALLPSCREKPAISNQIVVTAIALEKEGANLHLAVQAVESLKTSSSLSEQAENATAVYRAQGASLTGALQAFLNEAGRSTYILHNQVIAVGETLSRETSLFETLDYFFRNPEGRALVDVVICRGDPSSLLEIQSGNDAIPAEYVAQLLKEGERVGTAVTARLLDVQRASGGMYDMMIPLIEVKEKTPRLSGTMLFKQGCAVGELNEEQTKALLYAADRINTCLHTVNGITFRIVRSSTALHITSGEKGYEYAFEIDSRADIVESDHALTSEEKERLIQHLEKQLAVQIGQTVEKVVLEYGCDPLGLARHTAKQYKNITQEQSAALLPDSSYEVTVDIRVIESGLLQ